MYSRHWLALFFYCQIFSAKSQLILSDNKPVNHISSVFLKIAKTISFSQCVFIIVSRFMTTDAPSLLSSMNNGFELMVTSAN
jgi:hypothetical protein